MSENIDVQRRDPVDAIHTLATLSPEVLRSVSDEVKNSFVRALGKPQLVLIDVDPYRLHAFWTVTRESMESARNQLGAAGGDASMVLRVVEAETSDAGSLEGASFDVDVGGLQSRSYVDIFGETRRYRAVLGLRAAEDRFVALATSNSVELPPASSGGSDEVLQIDIDAPEFGTFLAQSAGPNDGVPARFPLPPDTPSGQDNPWVHGLFGPTAETPEAQPDVRTEAPSARPPLILEQALTSSSYALGRAGGFEITAELHVFGHAELDQELHLFGRKVPMRPDGSFFLRRLLPNDPTLIEALLAGGDTSSDEGDG